MRTKIAPADRLRLTHRYLASVRNLECPACAASGLEVIDLFTRVPMFEEPGMPPGPRYLCGQCLTEWDRPLAQAGEARRAETALAGSVADEHAVGEADAPPRGHDRARVNEGMKAK